MEEPSRHTLRQVKKRILRELTAFSLSDLSNSKSVVETEYIVVVDSKSSSSSMKRDKTESVDLEGSFVGASIQHRIYGRIRTSQILPRNQSEVSITCENLLYGSRTEVECDSET